MSAIEIVLNKLQTQRGITLYDFPIGTHFKESIRELRSQGYIIHCQKIRDTKGRNRDIGYYTYHGKQEKPYKQNGEYQKQVMEKLTQRIARSIHRTDLVGYLKLARKLDLSKGVLDFINNETMR